MNSELQNICRRMTLSLVIILTGSLSSFPQNYNIKTFTTDNGLTHNNVRGMAYDSTGFLWIATWDGLNRYDGYSFRKYNHVPGDSASIPFFSVMKVCVDGSDNLWILTDNGKVSRYNRDLDSFTTLNRINNEAVPVSPNMDCDQNGDLWIISFNYVYRYHHESGKFIRYSIVMPDGSDYLEPAARFNVTISDVNKLWLVGQLTYEAEINDNEKTLVIRKKYQVKIEEPAPDKLIRNYDHFTWFSMFIDREMGTWIFSNTGLFKLNENSAEFDEFTGVIPLKNFTGKEFFFWGNPDGGLNIYNSGSGSVIAVPASRVQLLKDVIFRDKNIIWYSNTSFTGNSLGLSRMIITPGYFRKYNVETESDKLPAVYSVTVDNLDRVWLGIRGRDHIVVITPENEIIKKYTPASKLPGFYGPVRSLKRTPAGIWVGYFYNMLLFYDYKTEKFIEYQPGLYLYRALEVAKDGKLFTGSNELVSFDPVTHEKTVITDSLTSGGVFRLIFDKDESLWAALPSGMFMRYRLSDRNVTFFRQKDVPNNVEDVCPCEKGNVWLALLGGGLVRYNTETNERRVYTTTDGLSNNTVYCILNDREGNIWASTDEGISRLNPTTGVIKKFGPSEGLDIIEFNSGASFADDKGRFYFGGMGGAVSFNPDSINSYDEGKGKGRIILSELTVSGNPKNMTPPVYKADTVILEKGEDNFHTVIATTDFSRSEKTNYRYRLTGHDKNWINTDHQNRNVNYINLRPGSYTLEIEATDRNGEWGASRNIRVIVKPYFYQRKIFYIFLVLLTIGLIHLIVSLYLRNMRIKNMHIHDELRLQALRGQMNPHFIFNSLNSINYFISNNDKLSANRYIADFSRLIRTILSNMGSDFVPFHEEIESVRDYLQIEHLRFGDKFDYIVDSAGLEDTGNLMVFPGLIQPFIENAIWHGVRALNDRKGFISVKVLMQGKNKVTCIIEDDGIGRAASAERRKKSNNHISRGIGIVNERLQIIGKLRGENYSLEITDLYPSEKETGTRVSIDMPVKNIQ
jgi:streptogramin lyase